MRNAVRRSSESEAAPICSKAKLAANAVSPSIRHIRSKESRRKSE